MTRAEDDRNILVRAIGFVEWCCWACGEAGSGFMPEHHASGACEATRTAVRPAEPGWKDPVFLVGRPFQLVPEVALAAQRMVNALMRGEVGYTDGGGI